MPENLSKNAIIPCNTTPETAKEKFERERITRRQALKRFGMTAGVAALAMFSVDDLAHIVGKAMQQRAGDNKVAAQIAKEFQQAGVAFANPSGKPLLPGGCAQSAPSTTKDTSCCTTSSVLNWCTGYRVQQCLTVPSMLCWSL